MKGEEKTERPKAKRHSTNLSLKKIVKKTDELIKLAQTNDKKLAQLNKAYHAQLTSMANIIEMLEIDRQKLIAELACKKNEAIPAPVPIAEIPLAQPQSTSVRRSPRLFAKPMRKYSNYAGGQSMFTLSHEEAKTDLREMRENNVASILLSLSGK